jgi:phosphoadenosine phosphosulfate reductase
MDERSALLYAKLHSYTRLVNRTHGFIRWALARVKTPYVACSFGKDSAVMLHMVLEQAPDIPVVFVRRVETDLIDNYQDVIQQWGTINLQTISYTGWLEDQDAARGIGNAVKSLQNFDSFFVGLRSDESVGRRLTLKNHGMFYQNTSGKTRICPLKDWNTKDITAYTYQNRLPILSKYLIEGFDARTTAAIPSKFPHETIQSLKTRDIESYNKLLTLLPDVKNFI